MPRRDALYLEKGNPRTFGTESIKIPAGPTADEPIPEEGMLRYDTDTSQLRGVIGGVWVDIATASGGVVDLDDLGDVTLTSPTNGQILKYNGTIWENVADSGGSSPESLAYTYNGSLQLTDIVGSTVDVDITYNGNGSIDTVVDNTGGTTTTYAYHGDGRILSTTVT